MAVRTSQFGREMDKSKKSLQSTFKRAADTSSTARKPDKFAKPSTGNKILLSMLRAKKRVFGSSEKNKPISNKRTQDITNRLKQAGLSQSDIDKMRGKKK